MGIIIAKIIGSIVFGLLAGCSVVYIFNRIPASWLCDYGQSPQANPLFDLEKDDPHFRRIKENPWRWVYSFGFMCLCLRLSLWGTADAYMVLSADDAAFQMMETTQLAIAGLFACWALLMIALADLKYMIIPDQFVLMLALVSFGFAPFYETPQFVTRMLVVFGVSPTSNLAASAIWQPIGGFVIGAGFMLLVYLIGRLVTRSEVMGFGDIKLCAAVGLLLGIQGTAITMVLSILAGGVIGAIGLMTGRLKKDSPMPMGTCICGAAMAYILIAPPY